MTEVATTSGLDAASRVVVLSGYGLRVAVRRRHLIVSDGIGSARRSGRLARATSGVKRVVILGRSGLITLDALRWLYDVGAGLIQIDNGDVVAAFGPAGLNDARLRRAQASASQSQVGLEIARALLREKLRGGNQILTTLGSSSEVLRTLDSAAGALESANSFDAMRSIEAQTAAAYWQAWANVPVVFSRADLPRVPDHWRAFGRRKSSISGSPRLATNPANAILNYLFAILEAETRVACLAVGLDPGMGIVHVDQRGRDSLALDITEAVRPQVEGFVLNLLRTQIFRASDFRETSRGQCLLLPPLTHALAATALDWGRQVWPVAERVVRMLASSLGARIARLSTPLTQTNRSLGRVSFRPRSRVVQTPSLIVTLVRRCSRCGGDLPKGRSYCDTCLVEYERETLAKLKSAGASAIARLAAQGKDPAHGGEAARKRARSNVRRMREAQEWDRLHPARLNPSIFTRKILPRLQEIPIKQIMRATGLSLRYCSLIRRGLYVPHPRHWPSFLELTLSTQKEARS